MQQAYDNPQNDEQDNEIHRLWSTQCTGDPLDEPLAHAEGACLLSVRVLEPFRFSPNPLVVVHDDTAVFVAYSPTS